MSESIEDLNIENEMLAIQSYKKELAEIVADKQSLVDRLMAEISATSEPYLERIRAREENIRNAALLRQSAFLCDAGRVTYRKGYARHSWDDKALMGYVAAGHDELLMFRKETEIKPSVSVEVF